jgi:hypothetical protein
MFFLLRVVFWLGVVCVLLPSGEKAPATPHIDTASAVTAAGAAVSDMRGFCDRQPQACVIGGKVATAIGQRAEAGARTLYELISTKLNEKSETKPIQTSASGTLTESDLSAVWHGPVPLPPPRREARNNRPAA